MYKLYVIFSEEAVKAMGGNRGKLAAQSGHAYLHAFWDSEERFHKDATNYRETPDRTKIALRVASKNELRAFYEHYRRLCGVSLVKDAGKTVFSHPTVTCLGLGPIHEEDVGLDLKSLRVFI